jgi:hypothetical protein|tara:strand:- start:376 stop:561 length:186 start_codon:yes stop_codon:yes gene_type:complete
MSDELERRAAAAIDKHERLLHLKTLELLLAAMVRRVGISDVRIVLKRYLDDLSEFDRQGPA